MLPPSVLPRLRCDVFCRVVDNFGDAAVCWRLARELCDEQGFDVRLVIDRPEVLAALQPAVDAHRATQVLDGVTIERAAALGTTSSIGAGEAADIVIDAFGGGLPEGYPEALAARTRPAVWIVLEYLSAEPWVIGHHRLASPHPALEVRRFFFFPGFGPVTGGLLRERGLIEARQAFDRDPQARGRFWCSLGQAAPAPASLVVSLFGYANPGLPGLLDAMAGSVQPTVLALAPGPLAAAADEWLAGRGSRITRGSARAGALEIRALPFLPQADYDRLLWACDLNFVRGEDSLVRAIWAARPLVWQLYPQQAHAHCVKLDAFLALCGEAAATGTERAAAGAMAALQRAWNGCGSSGGAVGQAGAGEPVAAADSRQQVAQAWTALAGVRAELGRQSARFSSAQAAGPDLAARLAAFCREKLK